MCGVLFITGKKNYSDQEIRNLLLQQKHRGVDDLSFTRHKNFIFSNGIDLIHEFFNIERKTKTNFLSKSVKLVGSQPTINKLFSKIADKGTLF